MSPTGDSTLTTLRRELAEACAERDAALARETATVEILQVINSSRGDLAPVFDTMLERALRLCEASLGVLWHYYGERFHAIAQRGGSRAFVDFVTQAPLALGPESGMGRVALGEPFVHFVDVTQAEHVQVPGVANTLAQVTGARTWLVVPLRKDDVTVGVFTIFRQEVRRFGDQQIALLQNFAAQAVIAMENARLITETREALEQQTATAEVLGVINSSPGDLKPVFDAILEKAHHLCGASYGSLQLINDDTIRAVAVRGLTPKFAAWLQQGYPVSSNVVLQRMAIGAPFVQVPDLAEIDQPVSKEAARAGLHTFLGVPLRHGGRLLGQIVAARPEVRLFAEKEIALLQNFAAQAVIAMENARLITETREALEQQTATAEVLGVINASPGDLPPVFDAMLEKAIRLCEAHSGFFLLHQEGNYAFAAGRGLRPEFAAYMPQMDQPSPIEANTRLAEGVPFVEHADLRDDGAYRTGAPFRRAIVDLGGARTGMAIAMRKDGQLLGTFNLFRHEIRPFTDKQIALVQNFAAQAVVAMENARLINETREALDQQTATAEVLGVINASPGDLAPVFDAVLEKAMRQCGASFGELRVYEGDELFRTGAIRGVPAAFAEHRRENAPPSGPNSLGARVLAGERIIHIVDLKNDAAYREGDANRRSLVDLGGARSALAVALRQDEKVLGFITLYRQEVRAYADKQIALLQNFAAQAVIAMENARLITETREALEQQTAVSDVLQVISRSAFDLQPVLNTLVETAGRLCDAEMTFLLRRDGDVYRAAAALGWTPEYRAFLEAHPIVPDRSTLTGRVVLEGRAVHILDIKSDPEYALAEATTLGGARTQLGVPLMRDGGAVGVIILSRQRVEPFSERQIKLVITFADQAVIAMENARLLGDLRERTEDLQQSLEYQTATSDVLKIISRSTFDLQPVLDTLVETAVRLCEGQMAFIYRRDGELYHLVASFGFSPEYHAYMASQSQRAGLGSMVGRVAMTARPVHIADAANDAEYTWTEARERGGYRTMLGVPLLREGEPIGLISIVRAIVKPFTDTQIELMTAFADQAGIAIENARLIGELREARDAAEAAFHDLQAAQSNLVQAQKMAALGQLTAGIAHEIKNPLNFVNNFASLSVELLDELKETAAPALNLLDVDKRADVDDTMELLTGNLEKIAEHGKRADNIVKSMLEHSRGVSGERREVDLNGVIEEALNLAYHGARAQDQSFNITLERDYAEGLEPIELAPQEITRVFLNLFGNGFYAASKRARDNGDGSFRPVLTVRTCEDGDAVEVRVRDNGTGIPPEVKDKLFQPFFTTKPTGEGTGLGLSISYDIVTQQHGGTITVESEPEAYTEFTVRLPRH